MMLEKDKQKKLETYLLNKPTDLYAIASSSATHFNLVYENFYDRLPPKIQSAMNVDKCNINQLEPKK